MEQRLLIVDDEIEVTSILGDIFLQEGYKVLVADNGLDAKKMLDQHEFDLVLLDIEMPGLSGMEVLEHIKKRYPDTKVIMVTGYGEYEDKAKKLGCDAFIEKPIALGALRNAIVSLLKQKDYEEIKSYSLRHNYDAPKGALVADILLVEPLLTVSEPIIKFLEDRKRSGGYFQVYHAVSNEQAGVFQEVLYLNIALINLRSVNNAAALAEALFQKPQPPKEFIFYLKENLPHHVEAVRKTNGLVWEASNPFQEESLEDLAKLIKDSGAKHNFIKS